MPTVGIAGQSKKATPQTAYVIEGDAHRLEIGQDSAGVLIRHPAGDAEMNPPDDLFEQRCPDGFRQGFDLVRDGWLALMQRLCRVGEVAAADRLEDAQLMDRYPLLEVPRAAADGRR